MKGLGKVAAWTALALLTAAPAFAADQLESRHTLAEVQADGEGSRLTFTLALRNSGTLPLKDVRLVARDPLIVHGTGTDTTLIAYIAAESSVDLTWTVSSSLPTAQLHPGMDLPFNLAVDATDASGAPASFTVTSQGGAL